MYHFSQLPAEAIDQYQRPGYIKTNNAGVEGNDFTCAPLPSQALLNTFLNLVCENRLSYLVAKGAVLRKGQRLRSRFCKYSRGALHSSLVGR